MSIRTIISLCLVAFLAACGSSAQVQKSWINKDLPDKDLHGVLVLAVATSVEGRNTFEQEFTQALQKHNIQAVASYTLKGGTDINKEDVAAMAAKAGVDTVLVTLFAGRDETAVLHPGRKYYAYRPVYGGGYYGRGRVYGVPYQVGETSDFWAEHKSVHLEASLFEIKTEDLLWRASSGMEEKSDVKVMRSAFIKSFMKDLAEHGLID